MNQEKEWWEEQARNLASSLLDAELEERNGMVGKHHSPDTIRPWFLNDIKKLIAEASRRAELKAWEKILAATKVRIKDHQIENIGDHHDAEGLTKAYHLAYKEMREIAEDRLTHLKKL